MLVYLLTNDSVALPSQCLVLADALPRVAPLGGVLLSSIREVLSGLDVGLEFRLKQRPFRSRGGSGPPRRVSMPPGPDDPCPLCHQAGSTRSPSSKRDGDC